MEDEDFERCHIHSPLSWSELLESVASSGGKHNSDGLSTGGQLTIIGSGLSCLDSLEDNEQHLKCADYVFYCINDYLTELRLLKSYPSAMNLSSLYSRDEGREVTYVQMSELMLYPVRRGHKVAAVFYGHPGVFAMPTHRAIQIARQEGYKALMRPGISALDHMIADLGFDPALPGLISYEATDLLLRKRTILTSLHLVIWQVGVIGEHRFDPLSYENRGLTLLVDLLECSYGPDWEVTNYIASTFPGNSPFIERMKISDLRKQGNTANISALSTFYVAPMISVATDAAVAERLSLLKHYNGLPHPQRSYINSNYGNFEYNAIQAIGTKRATNQINLNFDGPVLSFLTRLMEEPELRAEFSSNPRAVVDRQSELSTRSKELLCMRHDRAAHAALREETQQSID